MRLDVRVFLDNDGEERDARIALVRDLRDEGSDILVYSHRFGVRLQELAELLDGKACIANKTAHCNALTGL